MRKGAIIGKRYSSTRLLTYPGTRVMSSTQHEDWVIHVSVSRDVCRTRTAIPAAAGYMQYRTRVPYLGRCWRSPAAGRTRARRVERVGVLPGWTAHTCMDRARPARAARSALHDSLHCRQPESSAGNARALACVAIALASAACRTPADAVRDHGALRYR